MSSSHPIVEYREIKGFPGYRVGTDGTVWTCWARRRVGRQRDGFDYRMTNEWHRMTPDKSRSGHLRVNLSPGRVRSLVHRLVLEAFVGPCPEGMECRHFPDRDPSNNRLDNLQWGTKKQNQADRIAHGTDNRGEKQHLAKLDIDKVRSIRKEYVPYKVSTVFLAAKYGVSQAAVWCIVNRKTWKHV